MKTASTLVAVAALMLSSATTLAFAQATAAVVTAAEKEIENACRLALRNHPTTAGLNVTSVSVDVRRQAQQQHVVAKCTASTLSGAGASAGPSHVVLVRVVDLYVLGVGKLGDPIKTAANPSL